MLRIQFSALIFICLSLSIQAQTSVPKIKVDEILNVIGEQTPSLKEYQNKLDVENTELEERIIVLKYHKGNKEVDQACRLVVARVEEHYKNVNDKMVEFEHAWFEQLRNVMSVYAAYGGLREIMGNEGQNELTDFVKTHNEYLDLMDRVRTDLITLYSNMSFIKSQI